MRFALLAAAAAAAWAQGSAVNMSASDPRIAWVGRHVVNADGSVSADWESVEARFWLANGTTQLTVGIDGSNPGGQRYAVWVRGTATGYRWVRTASFWVGGGSSVIDVLPGYSLQYDVQVRLQRTVEPLFATYAGATTRFLWVASDKGFVATPPRSERRIEMLGDSITACLGNLGDFYAGCWASPLTQDYSQGYASAIGTAFDAEVSTLAWSGISLFDRATGPSLPGCPGGQCTLPDLYDWALPTLPGKAGNEWDFTAWAPQAVHINLGTK